MARAIRLPGLILLFAVVSLAACGQGQDANSLGDEATIAGTLVGWNKGAGYSFHVFMEPQGNGQRSLVASSPVSVDGKFALQLPSANEVQPFLRDDLLHPQSCSMPMIRPPNVRFARPYFRVEGPDQVLWQVLFSNLKDNGNLPPEYAIGLLWYSEQDADVSGDVTAACSDLFPSPGSDDMHLKHGWNWAFRHIMHPSPDFESDTFEQQTEPTPSDCRWNVSWDAPAPGM